MVMTWKHILVPEDVHKKIKEAAYIERNPMYQSIANRFENAEEVRN
ncbi:MAG: hypothetical protein AWU58_728 [Methanohalophilus sp. T328-1]|nr:MAG: hypothetical protein AWU58_728 [Methanohalophilus sp. T328-1]